MYVCLCNDGVGNGKNSPEHPSTASADIFSSEPLRKVISVGKSMRQVFYSRRAHMKVMQDRTVRYPNLKGDCLEATL